MQNNTMTDFRAIKPNEYTPLIVSDGKTEARGYWIKWCNTVYCRNVSKSFRAIY